MAATEVLEPVVAPPAPARYLSYAAPEFGYPGRACRVCGHRPCAVRLRWWVGVSRHAYFCAEHTAEANRACRGLRAGEVPPGHPLPPWGAARARARAGGALLERAAGLVDGRPRSA